MRSLAAPLHFAAAFLLAITAAGGVWAAATRRDPAPSPLSWRFAFGGAWVLIAAERVLHGTLVLASDWGIGAGVRIAALAILIAGTAAVYRELAGAGRLASALGVLAASEVVVALGRTAADQPGGWHLAAHGLQLAGGVALGWWLWRALSLSIQVRFVATFVTLLLVVVVSIATTMTQVFASSVSTEALRRIELEAQATKGSLDDRARESVVRARTVAEQDSVRAAAAQRSASLAELAARLQSPGGLFDTDDFMIFVDPSGAILAVSATGTKGPTTDQASLVALTGTAVVASALQANQAASIDLIGASQIGVIAAYPIRNPAGFDAPGSPPRLAGAVVLGRLITKDALKGLQAAGTEVTLASRDRVLASTLNGAGQLLAANAEAVRRQVIGARSPLDTQDVLGGKPYFTSFVALTRSDGATVAVLALSQSSDVISTTERTTQRTLFALALLATAVAVAASFFSGSRITRPILSLTEAAERVRAGDLGARVEATAAGEVGILAQAFNQMTQSVNRLTGDLRSSADEEARLRGELETILQSMTDGVIALDPSGSIVAFNREAERLFETTTERALGRDVKDVVRVRDSGGAPMAIPVPEGASITGFTAGAPGRGIPIAITTAPIEDSGGRRTGAVAVVRDLTREIEVERMKTEFLSNISHELRTPITPIKGYADLLRTRKVGKEQQNIFLDGIIASTGRLERIVEMLIDFSAMEAGRLVPRRKPFDLKAAVADLLARWKPAAPKHTFVTRGMSKLPMLDADERLLPRAINELVDNAVKFSPKGGRVTLAASLDASGTFRLDVSDQGIGVSEKQAGMIFGDFVQADASETRSYGGLGLGLSYVRRIVEGHGGRLEVESTPGKGARFTLVIPNAAARRDSRRSPNKSISK